MAIAAFIIAGGQSSRMGRDKAVLELGGKTLVARAVMLARTVSDEVGIVGPRGRIAELRNRVTAELNNPAELPNCRTAELKIVEDIFPGQGPLAGIHAALVSSSAELNLMLGVDSPFVEPRFLRYLVQEAEASEAVVTVPVVGSRLAVIGKRQTKFDSDTHQTESREPKTENPVVSQPLCAVYRREFAAVAEEALRARRNNIVPLFAKIATREIGPEELHKLAFDPEMFENLNTPEEWEKAQRHWR